MYFRGLSPFLDQGQALSFIYRWIRHSSDSQKPMMASVTGGNKKSNRLINEKSPYLLQHAYNPVDWYPWGEEAFLKAKTENKAIFLCHVMERESFENPSIGQLLNQSFVSVKVDREERPDVDKIYMTFIQATTQSGGWPMSVFLTPSLRPITGGTYFPPDDRFGRPGFATVIKAVAKAWAEQSSDLVEQSEQLLAALKRLSVGEHRSSSAQPAPAEVESSAKRCYDYLMSSFDPRYGGYGSAPKFPQPANLDFMLAYQYWTTGETERKKSLGSVERTLQCMARGGIYDHVSQGFHRYSTDAKWHVPHFEKMLYDQAQLVVSYAAAFQITDKSFYADVITNVLAYVDRDLSHPEGGFYSAEDADSYASSEAHEKSEGAFCVWTLDEINKHLSAPLKDNSNRTLADFFAKHFNCTSEGNVSPLQDPHGELLGKNVLTSLSSADSGTNYQELFDLSECEVEEKVKECCQLLHKVREKRPKSHLDDKMLTSWNGLMISGFARSAAALQEEAYAERARKAVDFARKHLTADEEQRQLLRCAYTEEGRVSQTTVPIAGFAVDYAFLIQGLLDTYECCYDDELVRWAVELQKTLDSKFWDEDGAGYFLSCDEEDTSVLLRMKEDQDGAEPSVNSVAASNLIRLANLLHRQQYRDRAEAIFRAFSARLNKYPFILPKMVQSLVWARSAPLQIVVVCAKVDEVKSSLLKTIHSHYSPFKVLAVVDKSKTDDYLTSSVDHFAKLLEACADDDVPKVYVCKNFACSLHVTSSEQLKQLLLNSSS